MDASKFKHSSVVECASDYIKSELLTGELRRGDQIEENKIEKILDVSRTPIREALIKLEKEGFIEILPRTKIRVKKICLKEIQDIYEVVGMLESKAAADAVDKLNEEDILEMEKKYKEMVKAIEEKDIEKYIKINKYLHNKHIILSGNKVLSNVISNQVTRLFDFPRIITNNSKWSRMLRTDHLEMIKLFKEKNKTGIEKIIKKHWSFDRSYPYIKEYKDIIENSC
ncbi:MAG: GntR family transcriptional regulator [Elusimicrobiota bacterium]